MSAAMRSSVRHVMVVHVAAVARVVAVHDELRARALRLSALLLHFRVGLLASGVQQTTAIADEVGRRLRATGAAGEEASAGADAVSV